MGYVEARGDNTKPTERKCIFFLHNSTNLLVG